MSGIRKWGKSCKIAPSLSIGLFLSGKFAGTQFISQAKLRAVITLCGPSQVLFHLVHYIAETLRWWSVFFLIELFRSLASLFIGSGVLDPAGTVSWQLIVKFSGILWTSCEHHQHWKVWHINVSTTFKQATLKPSTINTPNASLPNHFTIICALKTMEGDSTCLVETVHDSPLLHSLLPTLWTVVSPW